VAGTIPTPLCQESDIVTVLSQSGVDLRQDDAQATWPETSTNAPFTQPAAGADVAVNVGNGLWVTPGQNVYVTGGGFYWVAAITQNSITLMNLGTPGNTAVGMAVAGGAGITFSPLQEFIHRGTWEILEHCAMFYSLANLAISDWIRRHAAVVAAYLYCLRRGDPPPQGVAGLYAETKTKLERVQKGWLMIPLLPRTKASVPVMSNMRPALRPHPHVVVERRRSTGSPLGYHQNGDPWDMLGVNEPYVYDYAV
jgi:hypothetical protein